MSNDVKMEYCFQPHNNFLNKFRDVLRWLFFGILVWLLLAILGLALTAFLGFAALVLGAKDHLVLAMLIGIPDMFLFLACAAVIWFFPKTVMWGSYLVWLNNNVREKQMPYNIKSFILLTSLEAEAQKIAGSNRR